MSDAPTFDTVYPYQCQRNDGTSQTLEEFKGKVMLIVNTASECGFTPQYEGLQKLQETYDDQKFTVLAFPCNQFGKQEPGDDEQIASFCATRFSVDFPLFSKVEVNGDNAHPLFVHLKEKAPGLLGSKAIKWNFTKFLVDKNGDVVQRYAPTTKPEEIADDIEKLL